MPEDAPEQGRRERNPWLFKRPPGYFQCGRAIEKLQRFQDLARHHKRWAHGMELARPLPELFPRLDEKDISRTVIEREMKRLMPIVSICLRRAGVPTSFQMSETKNKWDFDHKELRPTTCFRKFDVIEEFLRLPHESRCFDLVIETLDKGIGFYTSEKESAFRRVFNPLVWIAEALHAPIFVLRHAGLLDETTSSAIVSFYVWALRLVFLAILLFVATKVGIEIPWSTIAEKIAGRIAG